jgi:hypothetical protein
MRQTPHSLAPLIPIIAPSSLSVTQDTISQSSIPTIIQNLNLSRTRQNLGDSVTGYTINFAEILGSGAAFNSYVGASVSATALIFNTLYSGRLVSSPSPCGASCSFQQSFFGPAYKCSEISSSQTDLAGNPFGADRDNFVPAKDDLSSVSWYEARNSTCDGDKDVCMAFPWLDGKLWIMYQYLLPEARAGLTPEARISGLPASAWERHRIVCQSYNASYSLQRSYSGAGPAVALNNLTFHNPLDFSVQKIRGRPNDDMQPEYAGYAIHQTLSGLLNGTIGTNGHFMPIDTTRMGGTQLVEAEPFPLINATRASYPNNPGYTGTQKPVRNLAAAIEQLHANITIGMLSLPRLVYLQAETVPAASSAQGLPRWTYNPVPLLAVYGAFLAANLLAAVLALAAVAGNGGVGVADIGFLRALLTTRSADFQAAVSGAMGRGEDYQQDVLRGVEVRFGELAAGGEDRVARRGVGTGADTLIGFGLRERVDKLKS